MEPIYEALEKFIPINVGAEVGRPNPSFGESILWHSCDDLTSRAISIAEPLDIVKLKLPDRVADLPEANFLKTLFQLVESRDDGVKVFVYIGTISTSHQVWFRPLPVFHINIKFVCGNFPCGNFYIQASVFETTRKKLLEMEFWLPETSTVEAAAFRMEVAVINAASRYNYSENIPRWRFVVPQFVNIQIDHLALAVLLGQSKNPKSKTPMKRAVPRRHCVTKKTRPPLQKK